MMMADPPAIQSPAPAYTNSQAHARAMADRAYRDATRHMQRDDAKFADLPNAKTYGAYLDGWAASALTNAYKTSHDGWHVCHDVPADQLRKLRVMGLVGMATRGLTGFGWSVRKALLGDAA